MTSARRQVETRGARPRRRAALAVLAAALLAAAGAANAETMLRARLNSDILSTEPGMKRDENTDTVLLHAVEGLVALRNDGSVAPMLASGWAVSPDRRTYAFRLRPEVRFHNGAPLTSAEVVWSLRRYFDPQKSWRCKSAFGANGIARIVSVAAVGRDRVDVTLDRPAPLFLKTLARADCGAAGIVHPASVGPDGKWRVAVGTGPFRIGEWRRNQFIDLVRFTGYRPASGPRDGLAGAKHAQVDRIRFAVIPDGSAAAAALLRGSLDVLDGLAPNELGNVRRGRNVRLVSAPTMDAYYVLLQTRDPVLADPRLRRALALSLDTEGLSRVAGRGQTQANSSPVPAASPFHGPAERVVIRRDLTRARALVKASGYRGQPIRLITNRRYPQAFDAAILFQAMARDAGIKVEIVTLDWAGQLARYASGDYQAMVFGFSARMDPSFNYDILVGEKRTDPRKVWDSAEARRLLQASIVAESPAERQAVFDRLEQAFRADVPAIALFNTSRVTAVRTNVAGFQSWTGGLTRLWDVGLR